MAQWRIGFEGRTKVASAMKLTEKFCVRKWNQFCSRPFSCTRTHTLQLGNIILQSHRDTKIIINEITFDISVAKIRAMCLYVPVHVCVLRTGKVFGPNFRIHSASKPTTLGAVWVINWQSIVFSFFSFFFIHRCRQSCRRRRGCGCCFRCVSTTSTPTDIFISLFPAFGSVSLLLQLHLTLCNLHYSHKHTLNYSTNFLLPPVVSPYRIHFIAFPVFQSGAKLGSVLGWCGVSWIGWRQLQEQQQQCLKNLILSPVVVLQVNVLLKSIKMNSWTASDPVLLWMKDTTTSCDDEKDDGVAIVVAAAVICCRHGTKLLWSVHVVSSMFVPSLSLVLRCANGIAARATSVVC